jgi:hypothetical protein
MKKGRISKVEEGYIRENIQVGYEQLALDLDRDKNSLLEFIKKKVAKGDLPEPQWLGNKFEEEKARYNLSFRPYWTELQAQFTVDELKLFEYHWTRIISQFADDVIPTEEIQVVDLIKLELLMNRSLKSSKSNLEQISAFEALIAEERQRGEDADSEAVFNLERQIAALRASQESLNRDYRDLQDKKNKMLKEMKATREQRVQRFEDKEKSWNGLVSYLVSNPQITQQYGHEMEQMRIAAEKEKERLSKYHKYTDGMVDQPFLTPETVKD